MSILDGEVIEDGLILRHFGIERGKLWGNLIDSPGELALVDGFYELGERGIEDGRLFILGFEGLDNLEGLVWGGDGEE